MRITLSLVVLFACAILCPAFHRGADEPGKIKALIVDGQNNHAWQKTTPVLTTLDRGAEWAATGRVTQKVPENFPTEDRVVPWEAAR